MPNAYISGTGMFVPDNVVTNDDLREKYGMDTTHEWIVKRTGIEERRYAPDGMGAEEMGAKAAEQAIADAGLQKSDIGMIIAATLSPRHCFPGSACYIQQHLDLPNVPAMDIRNQCSGFMYAYTTACSLVQAGGVDNVLVIGCECHSHALDLTTRGRTVASLFGDGAGAVVVSRTDEDRGLRSWNLGADGRFADDLCQKVWDIRRTTFFPLDTDQDDTAPELLLDPSAESVAARRLGNGVVDPSMMWAHMDGRKVFRHAVEKMITSLMTVCWEQKITVHDLDLVLMHQANLRINQYVADQLKLPEEKTFHNIMRYGNTTAATLPLLMAEATRAGKLKPGMKVGLVAFGSGFTWGAAVLDW